MPDSRILKHLNHFESCPECRSAIKSEEFDGRTHCNGQQFESITFRCGCKIEWSPNFERAQVNEYHKCPHSKENVAERERQDRIIKKIIDMIPNLELTEKEKTKFKRYLNREFFFLYRR